MPGAAAVDLVSADQVRPAAWASDARIVTPTLVLHAPDDKEVPFGSAESLAAAGPHVLLQALPGLGHRRILTGAATVAATVAFFARD